MGIPDALGWCADVSYMLGCYWLAAGAAYCAIRERAHLVGTRVSVALDLTVIKGASGKNELLRMKVSSKTRIISSIGYHLTKPAEL